MAILRFYGSLSFRISVLVGSITPSKLVVLNSHDMASADLIQKRKEFQDYYLAAAQDNKGKQQTTDMFRCGKCGKRETTYYQLQTRRSANFLFIHIEI
jgi:transcription elongation factor S-II